MARKTLRRILLLPLACCFPLTLDASTQTYEYAYDDAGRLTEVRTEASVIDYDYDDAGNIIGRSGGPNLQIFDSGFEGDAP